MSINPLKEFFKRRKAEVKFARAGPGKTLSSESQSRQPSSSSSEQSSASQAAAEAAMKRFNRDNTKPPQKPRVEAQNQTQQPSRASQPTASVSSKPEETEGFAQKNLPVVDGIIQRNIQVYSTEELAQRTKQPEIDDDFFRLTVEDAKLFQSQYEEERKRNEILKTSEMRRREAESKKPTTNIARIRFKLPNNMILEASFSGNENLALVRDWLIAACMEKTGLNLNNFDMLFGLRPFKDADFNRSVKQLGLIPATTLTIIYKNT